MEKLGEKLLTVKEVCAHLDVNPITIYRLVEAGKLPAYKFAKIYRFNVEDIVKFKQDILYNKGRRVKKRAKPTPQKSD